jgi:hypothetical protein
MEKRHLSTVCFLLCTLISLMPYSAFAHVNGSLEAVRGQAKPISQQKSYRAQAQGMKIKSIIVSRFPGSRNGKAFDSKSHPDLYLKLKRLDGKRIGRTEVQKDCQPNRMTIFKGKDMPFLIEPNRTYTLQLRDKDSDRRNKDEDISKPIPFSIDRLKRLQGDKDTYSIEDKGNKVELLLHVEKVTANVAKGDAAYIKGIKSMDQKKVPPKKKVYEGCGPVAAAMLMGYWHTEQGYDIMNPKDNFDGTGHPTATILEFRKVADTKAWLDSDQSATRKMKMKDGLQYFVKRANANSNRYSPKLKVEMLWNVRRNSKVFPKMKKELRQGSPVILLLRKLPPCLKGKWVNATPIVSDHYIVAAGYDDSKKEVYVLPGWKELDASKSTGPSAHKDPDNDEGLCTCSYSEIKGTNPGLLVIKR